MKLFLLIATILALIGISYSFVCAPNYCSLVDCNPSVTRESCEANANYLFEPNGGTCGCCPLCVHLIGEGERCPIIFSGGTPPTSRCAPGLVCNADTFTCEKPKIESYFDFFN